jgi:hypothetical protein
MKKSLILLVLPLFGCINPTYVDFANSQGIFRGVWESEAVSATKLRLDLTATFVDSKSYGVVGTLQFDAETPINVSGTVQEYESERYYRTPELRVAQVEFNFVRNQTSQSLICSNAIMTIPSAYRCFWRSDNEDKTAIVFKK